MTITQQAEAAPAWPYPGVSTVRALVAALGAAGEPAGQQASAVRQFMQDPAWRAAPPVLQRDVTRWLGLLYESQAEFSITGQAIGLAADVTPEAMQAPGLPVPDDPAAVSMFTAHRLDDGLHALAHATERMTAARAADSPGLRAYHSAHIFRHLQFALDAAHDLTANIREHYPAEAAELEQVKQAVGLAKSLTPEVKAATTAHLLETTLHEETHGVRHAEAMLEPEPDSVWTFNADHCEKHLGGAVEHAAKLAQHFRDNYPDVAKWLTGLDEITSGAEEDGGGQHARYARTVSAQMANPETLSGQLLDLSAASRAKAHATASATARLHAEEHWHRDAHGRFASAPGASAGKSLPWGQDGDVMHYRGSLGVDRADMPQISGTLADGRYAPSSEMMPKFLDQLKAKGVDVSRERVPASSLKPTQATGDARAARGIADSLASGDLKDTKPVLVSSDGRVVDGHHQWAAHVLGEAEGKRTGSAPGEPVIRADLPADQLMAEARQFAKDQGIQNRKTGVAANPKYAREGIRALPADAQHFIADANAHPGTPAVASHPGSIAAQAAPEDTLEKYTRPDGTLTPERAALHQKIINDILAGHEPQQHPVATFFGGGPASGKSTALKPGEDSAVIDSDEIKARLPEYQQMLDAGNPKAASFVHEESSQISKQAMAEAQKRRLNYTLDGTGDSDIAKMAGKVNAARQHGYLTEGQYVTTGTDEAVRRAQKRAEATGRHVPETFIRETHAAVSDTYGKAAKMGLFDKTALWDTTGTSPKLVASKEPSGKFAVHDPAAWQGFLDKAQEGSIVKPQAGSR